MFCRKCGAQLNEDERFCYKCGTDSYIPGESTDSVKRKQRKPWLILLGVAVAFIILVGVLVYMMTFGNTEKKYNEQLALAERYLDKLDYDQAIAAYKAAIEIDPQKADAYLGLAKAYEESGKIEKALEVLENGYKVTENRRIQRKLDEIKNAEYKEKENAVVREETVEEKRIMQMISLDSIPELEKLEAFLGRFGWYSYDNEFSKDQIFDKNNHTMLDHIITWDECCIEYKSYPVKYLFDYGPGVEERKDPLRRYEPFCYTIEEKDIDWILSNIFNYSNSAISEMKETWKDLSVQHPIDGYLYDGVYYLEFGTGDGGFFAQVDKAWFDGQRYKIQYHLIPSVNNGVFSPEDEFAPQEAEMLLKNIDGTDYWTILSNKEIKSNDQSVQKESDDSGWKKAYADLLAERQYGPQPVGLVYLDDDDIPELFFIYGPGADYNFIYCYRDGEVKPVVENQEIWVVERESTMIYTFWQESGVTRLSECRDGMGEPGGVWGVYKWDSKTWDDFGWAKTEMLASPSEINGRPASYEEFLEYAESLGAVRLNNIAMDYDELLSYLME